MAVLRPTIVAQQQQEQMLINHHEVLEPLDDRGRIDFITALNRSTQPVKAEENAALALIEVLGSGFEDEGLHQKLVHQLGGVHDRNHFGTQLSATGEGIYWLR